MSADRETNHDMATHRDIAFLLAEAADEVEIGIAPYQAVVRGGRRRKARRWAVAAAAALVIAGSTGTLALAGAMGGDGKRVAPVATQPPTAEQRHVYAPQRTLLARARDNGKDWSITIDVWGAPKNEAEAQRQWEAMGEYQVRPVGVKEAKGLIGKDWHFVHRIVGDDAETVMWGEFKKGDELASTDLTSAAMTLPTGDSAKAGAPQRLVIGDVAPTARQVTCTWDDGTTTQVPRAPEGAGFSQELKPMIRPVEGSQPNWFVCLAPEGKTFKSVKVTG
ncbi:hypothetical protein [Streptomyces sp. NPDC001530]|uniref:hypothetical protein n=1 Tax=Streptomyces sp. NPDC001530 TaxID=3364582 RepID=UPI00367CCD50